MPCGMTRRRIRNASVTDLLDVDGTPIPEGADGVVDPHEDGVLAYIASGRIIDLGPGEKVTPLQEAEFARELGQARDTP